MKEWLLTNEFEINTKKLFFFFQIKNFNVMFVDNPVGTGFSYVDDVQYLTKTNLEIGKLDILFTKLTDFLLHICTKNICISKNKDKNNIFFYIFC